MSRETIKLIHEAEEQAKQLKIKADNNAKQMLSEERERGEAFLAEAEKAALEEAEKLKISTTNTGKKIISDAEAKANEIAKSIEQTAKNKLSEAINIIIEEACS